MSPHALLENITILALVPSVMDHVLNALDLVLINVVAVQLEKDFTITHVSITAHLPITTMEVFALHV